MSNRQNYMRARNSRAADKSKRVETIAIAIILTFCIVFALLININSHKVRKDKLALAEKLISQKQIELSEAQEIANHREQCAKESLDSATAMMKKYETSLSEAIIAESKSKQLIDAYAKLNHQLTEQVIKNESLGKEQEQKIAEVKRLREKTLSMRRSVINFYQKTKDEKTKATKEIAKSQRAYEISLKRLNEANQLKNIASATIIENRDLADRVNRLENDLSYSNRQNYLLRDRVIQSNQHIDYHHHNDGHRTHSTHINKIYCPPTSKSTTVTIPHPKSIIGSCRVLPLPKVLGK